MFGRNHNSPWHLIRHVRLRSDKVFKLAKIFIQQKSAKLYAFLVSSYFLCVKSVAFFLSPLDIWLAVYITAIHFSFNL